MGTELAVAQKENRLAVAVPEYSTEQIRILAETVAKGCDQNELAFFLQVCKLKRLDPFSGQVHCMKRWDSDLGREKVSVQIGIDGFRVIASRTQELAGTTEPEYDSEDGIHPNWARITVYRYGRDNEKIPYTVKARWSEYVQTKKDGNPNRMWVKMPYNQLAKCAESQALRKAFPDELSGMYTDEEMEQADSEHPGAQPGPKPQVQMPRSTDEKKLEAPKAGPQAAKAETVKQNPPAAQQGAAQGQPQAVEISGEIEKVSPGKGQQEGTLWLVVNKKVICVPANLIDAEMCVGAKILITASEQKGGTVQKYIALSVEMLVAPTQDGEIIDAEVSEPEEKREPGQPDPVLEEARAAGLGGIFDETPGKAKEAPAAQAAPAGEATRPGTAGLKRAQRLHTLISQNSKNTLFTEDLLKKYLATQRIEHARDLACPPKGSEVFNAYEYACSMAVGEVDWHEVLED